MLNYFLDNTTIDRLPAVLAGIAHVEFKFELEVCPKLNNQKSSRSLLN